MLTHPRWTITRKPPRHRRPPPQDRITRDGSLVPAHQAPSPNPRSPLAPAAPVTPPATDAQIAALVELLTSHRRVTVLTGAGCSTESNIPDYRSPNGAYSSGFKPMTHQKVVCLTPTPIPTHPTHSHTPYTFTHTNTVYVRAPSASALLGPLLCWVV